MPRQVRMQFLSIKKRVFARNYDKKRSVRRIYLMVRKHMVTIQGLLS